MHAEHPDTGEPRRCYQQRLEQRQQSLTELEQRNARLATARGLVFAVGVLLAISIFYAPGLNPGWLGLPILGFAVLVLWHDRVIRDEQRARLCVAYYRAGLDRIDDAWMGQGVQSTDYVDAEHPYAADLDLFGEASLFELLCTARTRGGEERLASWLAQGAPLDQLRARQQAVAELRPRLDLREDLAALAEGVRAELNPRVLVEWASAEPAFAPALRRVLVILGWGLTAAAAISGLAWGLGWVGAGPLLAVALIEWAVGRALRRRVSGVVEPVERAARELTVLQGLLQRLEREQAETPRLRELLDSLRGDGRPASLAIAGLDRRVRWLESRRNAFFAPFAFLLMWSLHGALAVERWRLRAGARVPAWLDSLAELEALAALASYSYEHPEDPFPELVEDGPRYQGERLGHPLLPAGRCVRNDASLVPEQRIWLVSGSNMSGKSTLLRTVGINAVLAMAGAPVRAASLTLSPLQLGATIRLQDSLQQGASRFYAEITRLKQLMDLASQTPPLLFLVDEILHGTNSHDRRIGAAALLATFVARDAIGLVTTHDLAIAEQQDALAGQLRNVHFADEVHDGKLVFDYRVRQGVVTKSNALEWMRAVGLEV